jgi:hypothetical protein
MTIHAQPANLSTAECGHTLALVDGELQHHDIPDDGAPHAATSECGCGPARYDVRGHIVYEHVDQDLY